MTTLKIKLKTSHWAYMVLSVVGIQVYYISIKDGVTILDHGLLCNSMTQCTV